MYICRRSLGSAVKNCTGMYEENNDENKGSARRL